MNEQSCDSISASLGEFDSLLRIAKRSECLGFVNRRRAVLLQRITDFATSIIDTADRVLFPELAEKTPTHMDPTDPGAHSAFGASHPGGSKSPSRRLEGGSGGKPGGSRRLEGGSGGAGARRSPGDGRLHREVVSSLRARAVTGTAAPHEVEEVELTAEDVMATLALRDKLQVPYYEIVQVETTEVEKKEGAAPMRIPAGCFAQTLFAFALDGNARGMRESNGDPLENSKLPGECDTTLSTGRLAMPVEIVDRHSEGKAMAPKCKRNRSPEFSILPTIKEADITLKDPDYVTQQNIEVANFKSTLPLMSPMDTSDKTEKISIKMTETTSNCEEGFIVLRHVTASDWRIHTMTFKVPPPSRGTVGLHEVKDISIPMELRIESMAPNNNS